jgi:hypothetical protein
VRSDLIENEAMAFTGKFERVSAENFDEFLKALDVGGVLRAAASASTPVMEVRHFRAVHGLPERAFSDRFQRTAGSGRSRRPPP